MTQTRKLSSTKMQESKIKTSQTPESERKRSFILVRVPASALICDSTFATLRIAILAGIIILLGHFLWTNAFDIDNHNRSISYSERSNGISGFNGNPPSKLKTDTSCTGPTKKAAEKLVLTGDEIKLHLNNSQVNENSTTTNIDPSVVVEEVSNIEDNEWTKDEFLKKIIGKTEVNIEGGPVADDGFIVSAKGNFKTFLTPERPNQFVNEE